MSNNSINMLDYLSVLDPEWVKHKFPIAVITGFSIIGALLLKNLIQACANMFISANFSGVDMSKRERKKIPEAQGVLCGAIYLIIMFLFIPIAFWDNLVDKSEFPHREFIQFLAALLSICCMIFLGFADDALNLRWRHKLVLPTIASLPLLMVYLVNISFTTIIVPKPFRQFFGYDVDIGILYYIYMGMLAVFCTNAINIYAGINGLEAGQSLVIAISVLTFNIIEIQGQFWQAHIFSLYFMIPFIAVCAILLYFNWYPSEVFVGDTFCYFAGMTFAVVGILGHFSKTLLLFFIPQIVNFIYSVPQLFHFIPCPRHRLPKYNADTDTLTCSTTQFRPSSLNFVGYGIFRVLTALHLVQWRDNVPEKEGAGWVECNNLTLINMVIRLTGPVHEEWLTRLLLALQVVCTGIAFFIRYPLAWVFYDL